MLTCGHESCETPIFMASCGVFLDPFTSRQVKQKKGIEGISSVE